MCVIGIQKELQPFSIASTHAFRMFPHLWQVTDNTNRQDYSLGSATDTEYFLSGKTSFY
jgi:hypothetical protein